MKVLLVNHLLDAVSGGGTAERTFQLGRALAQSGAECSLLTLDIGITADRREALHDVRIVAIPSIWRRFFVPAPAWGLLKREVAAADIVHIMGHWTLLNALVYLAARRADRPYVVCPAGALPIVGRSGLLKKLYNRVVGRRIVRLAAAHIAITRDETTDFFDYGVDPTTVIVIPNGIAPQAAIVGDRAQFLARHGVEGRRFVLFLGRLAYIKGPDLLLEAFAAVSRSFLDIDLVYAGPDDGMLEELRGRAVQLGLHSRVRFIGYVDGADKALALEYCEMLVVPSRREAMSIVALEAAARGKPVLLTDRCGFGEIEQAGGGRVTRADADSLEQALADMLANPGELARMGGRLKEFVVGNYTWDRAAAEHMALFRRIVGVR